MPTAMAKDEYEQQSLPLSTSNTHENGRDLLLALKVNNSDYFQITLARIQK